jgi:biotin/methionine sulfoxide reductase
MTERQLTSSHWGVYEIERKNGVAVGLKGLAEDPDPSLIGLAMWEAYRSPLRIQKPALRKSWLQHGPGSHPELRGREPFVEVSWDEALDLLAKELQRVREQHGNEAIFGGSYGWSSAGRFHHAQSQVHRFLNSIGGYVRSVDSYSLGAARVLMPHIVAPMDELMAIHHSWDVVQEHTRLLVSFGGIPAKNGQVSPGGSSEHRIRDGLSRVAARGCRLINFSPVRDNFDAPEGTVEWIPIRPNTDAAAMLALAYEIIDAGTHDRAFLARYCTGFEVWENYLLGRTDGVRKDAHWASAITGVPARRLQQLAKDLVGTRSLVNMAWSLQRADHGEQPCWALVGLAAVIGQIGLPGGGFGMGYGPVNAIGSPYQRTASPTMPQGKNAVASFIPVARIADMLLHPGEPFEYNGGHYNYADIDLIYWAGGNPFHHHQDLNRLAKAWRKPSTIVVHEQFWNAHAKMADIVLPATSTLERDDLGASNGEPLWVAMKAAMPAPGQARDDFAIFSDLAQRLGVSAAFTEGRTASQWIRHLYEEALPRARAAGLDVPTFDVFWKTGEYRLPISSKPLVMLECFRADPITNKLNTPSGLIEIFSAKVASFAYAECPGYPIWAEPAEWLGARNRVVHDPQPEVSEPEGKHLKGLHLISDQPHTKLHSQLDHSSFSRAAKVAQREAVMIHPDDARHRSINNGDIVRLHNQRGTCLAGAVLSDTVMPGVVRMSTGAWWDPVQGDDAALDKHGNANVLTRDVGASRLSQGCAAQTCIVQVERLMGPAPEMSAYQLPNFIAHPISNLAVATDPVGVSEKALE